MLKKVLSKNRASKLAPIGTVMLLEALAIEAQPQHLSVKRDQSF